MKASKVLYSVVLLIVGFYVGAKLQEATTQKIELPEEFTQIDFNTPIRGNYSKQTKTLTIEFDNTYMYELNENLQPWEY